MTNSKANGKIVRLLEEIRDSLVQEHPEKDRLRSSESARDQGVRGKPRKRKGRKK